MLNLLTMYNTNSLPTIETFQSILKEHIIDAWFPRSLDLEYGGFLCDFNRFWKLSGKQEKLLEFQARHTMFAAAASKFYPKNQQLKQAVLHGLNYLEQKMWDHKFGGWFHLLDRQGTPLHSRVKHLHGFAYAIEACSKVYEVTGETKALKLAQEAFNWMEHYAYDNQYGGYFGFLKEDGKLIRDKEFWEKPTDTISTPINCKDANIHSDFLEAFFYLYRVWPSDKVKKRLIEVLNIMCEKMYLPSGSYFFFKPDWTPIPYLEKFGYVFTAIYRLFLTKKFAPDEKQIEQVICQLTDHLIECALDNLSGGYFFAGPAIANFYAQGIDLRLRKKLWWVEFEALRALLLVSKLKSDNHTYQKYFCNQWDYIENNFLDFRHKGTYYVSTDSLPLWQQILGKNLAPKSFTKKGDFWKDASHDGLALLHGIFMLQKEVDDLASLV